MSDSTNGTITINAECVICGNETQLYLYYNNPFCLECLTEELEEIGLDNNNEDFLLIKACKDEYDRYKVLIDLSIENIANKMQLDIKPLSELFCTIGGEDEKKETFI